MYKYDRYNLLSSNARIQVPWVKVTFRGENNSEYTFGIFSKNQKKYVDKSENGFSYWEEYGVQYPNYVQSLQIVKINGQVNQYTLNIVYPITPADDPNFFEKIFSSVSKTRKIIFSYGDAAVPSFVYKDEEAVITTIQQTFNLSSSSISYTINAISGAALHTAACVSFPARSHVKPSAVIKEIFFSPKYNLQEVFTGMNISNWNCLVAQNDAEVDLQAKTNISAIDYLNYLVSCMYYKYGSKTEPKSIYVLTIHDELSAYEKDYTYSSIFDDVRGTDKDNDNFEITGTYFKVSKVSYNTEKSDAYEIDIGYNTSNIVTSFSLENNENYSLYYDYQMNLANNTEYVTRINNDGTTEKVYAPAISSKNNNYITNPEDITWWTKITQFPVNANITVMGLLRPARLLTYIRLNVIFPGGHKHISSGLYIITKQVDTIDFNGYKTQLSMTKVSGDLLQKTEEDE